jgi:hypothetical protein
MWRVSFCGLGGIAACLLLATGAGAGGRNVADYPLRVHIFQVSQHSHYYYRVLDRVDGEGRANLYEDSHPRGFDFSFVCGGRLMTSPGFETYLARWKKTSKDLEILLPVMGKPGATLSCELKVDLKETAYYRHGGAVEEEPAAAFKEWMEKHQYDPEHGKDEPTTVTPTPAGTATTAPQ